ncbi:MAG: DEAD/DEAH box helicase [Bacteroidales bacterium]|jgi:ATP-dependent RNA helicase RhlE|nr:DEAD/DEAH box helicase [Bacteroidales bacterium]
MKFDDYKIADELKESIRALGFKRPTDIQFKSIQPILSGDDVLAIAQTGTGKTAAFAIPIIDVLNYRKKTQRRNDGIRAVVMVPTRELAIQITEVFNKLEQGTLVKTFGVFGGVEQDPQIAELQKGFDIMVATPGRLFDLTSQGHLQLHRINILVLDEADHMLALGFIKDIRQLITHLPKKRQTLFFSATIDKEIKKLAYSLVDKPFRIQIAPEDPVSRNVNHKVAFVEMDDKRFFLERLIKENPEAKILVFVRTKVRAERVAKAMERADISAKTIHGDKDQKDRTNVMSDFKSGKIKVLVATDVSARGIDVDRVEFVVNYDLPEQAENYVHRVGRTGRGDHRGFAISFCAEEEKHLLKSIEEYIGKPVYVNVIRTDDYIETRELSEENPADWKSLMEKPLTIRKKKKRK